MPLALAASASLAADRILKWSAKPLALKLRGNFTILEDISDQ